MPAFEALAGASYMSLTTFRRDGRAVPTPVWFAQDGDRLYVLTQPEAGKVKRIRNSGVVTVAPCTARGELTGPAADAFARMIDASGEADHANRLLTAKYGMLKRILMLMGRLRGSPPPVYIEITAR